MTPVKTGVFLCGKWGLKHRRITFPPFPNERESCPRQGKVAIIPMIAYEIMEVFAKLLKWPKGVHFPKAKPWL